jgi:hypothetical protein
VESSGTEPRCGTTPRTRLERAPIFPFALAGAA